MRLEAESGLVGDLLHLKSLHLPPHTSVYRSGEVSKLE